MALLAAHSGPDVLVQAGEAGRRSVLFILADDMSPHLSMLGTPGIRTPRLDALAESGTYFPHAFSASASCAPSRAAILTGMWPHSNGTWRNVHTPPLNLPDQQFGRSTEYLDPVGIGADVRTLPEIFRENGYFTGLTQKLHVSPAWRYPYEARDPVQSKPEQFRRVIGEFLRDAEDRPFFIHANIAAPHRPYRNHLKSNPEQELPDADVIDIPPFLPDIPGVRRDMREYFACVEITDACVSAILEALADSGRADETLVVFSSDHGMPIHYAKASAYPPGTRIPLIIAGPGLPAGQVRETAVSQIDFAPTMLEFCGIAIPEGMQGESLLQLLADPEALPSDRIVFAEHNSHGPNPKEFYPQRVATDGQWYYIRNLQPDKKQLLPEDLRGEGAWGNDAYQSIIDAGETHPDGLAYLELFDRPRPKEHLFHLEEDFWGVEDLADSPDARETLEKFRVRVEAWREATGDIRKSPLEIPRRPGAEQGEGREG